MTQGNKERQHRWDSPVRQRSAAARALEQRQHRQRVIQRKRPRDEWDDVADLWNEIAEGKNDG